MKSFARMLYPYLIWIAIMILAPMLLIILYAFTKQGNSVLTLQFTLEPAFSPTASFPTSYGGH